MNYIMKNKIIKGQKKGLEAIKLTKVITNCS